MAATGDSPDLSMAEPSSAVEDGRAAGPAPSSVPPKEAPTTPPAAALEPARRNRWVVWLLAVALAVALLWGFSQGRYAAQLSSEVDRLEAELSVVGVELDAHRSHLANVRMGVDDVAGRMLALRELAHLDPMATSGDAADDAGPAKEGGSDDVVVEAEPAAPALPPAAADF